MNSTSRHRFMCGALLVSALLLDSQANSAERSSFEDTQAKAKTGNVEAQNRLGMMYLNGDGVTQNASNAVIWLRLAGEGGHREACAMLGELYADGVSGRVDYVEAYQWLNLAALRPEPNLMGMIELRDGVIRRMTREQVIEAQRRLLREHPQILSSEFKATKARAEGGDTGAQYQLAQSYANGEGVWIDDVEAARWFRRLAENGNAAAQYELARLYVMDRGVKQDLNEAERWLRKAARQNYPEAQVGLGLMYLKGQNLPRDVKQAIKWFRRAADQGLAGAQLNLGILYDKGDGVPVDFAAAAKWYRQAAEAGNGQAQYNLGKMCAKGEGPPQDDVEAYKWISLAAAQESSRTNALTQSTQPEQMIQEYFRATLFLETLKQRMKPEQIAEAKRRAAQFVPARPKAALRE